MLTTGPAGVSCLVDIVVADGPIASVSSASPPGDCVSGADSVVVFGSGFEDVFNGSEVGAAGALEVAESSLGEVEDCTALLPF